LPVICTDDTQAQAELLNRHRMGLVLETRDPEKAARKIVDWNPPSITPEKIKQAGLTWEQESKLLERIYSNIGVVRS
jgi:hypothetical protein